MAEDSLLCAICQEARLKKNEAGDTVHAVEWAALLECAAPDFSPARLAELLPGEINWQQLLALAEEHGLLALLAERAGQLPEFCMPRDVRKELHERRREQIVFSMGLNAELFQLLEKFSTAGLEAVVLKGPALSVRAYGDTGTRRYEDLDLLVRQKEIFRFAELLTAGSYESKIPLAALQSGKVPGEYVFWWQKTLRRIELHTEQTLRYFPRPLPIDELFARRVFETVDARNVPALCVEDEFILVCIHNAKHFWERLCWIADVAALISRQKNLNWAQALRTARSVGAERMLALALLLAKEVLRVEVPSEMEEEVRSDRGAMRLAGDIIRRLPLGGAAPRGLAGRAAFRMRMRGGMFSGPAYLLRLTLSPTEEDWNGTEKERRLPLSKLFRRPLRLAQKYRRKEG